MKYVFSALLVMACSKHANPPTPAAGSAAPSELHAGPHHEDRHDPAIATPPLSLAVTIDGSGATWPQAVFDRTPHVAGTANDGEARDTWSLRELVHGTVGERARVTAVIGETTQAIDAAAWADATRTPIIHRTRRGTLKFRWADAAGAWGEAAVKDVTGLEISSK